MSILAKYYNGIVMQVSAELEHINSILEHQGEKGSQNEQLMIRLLRKFLPKRFSIGSGIVIDSDGTQSKQCDIIIYDNVYHPDIFGLRSSVIFPVETVYATIEVKTTLRRGDIKTAIENIESVKKLKYIEGVIPYIESPGKPVAMNFKTQKTSSPWGIVFGYKTDISQATTLKNNFLEFLEPVSKEHHFDLGFILEKGFVIGYQDFWPHRSFYSGFYGAVGKGENGVEGVARIEREDLKELHPNDRNKILQVDGKHYIVNPARAFVNFLIDLLELLHIKKIYPNPLLKEYVKGKYDRFVFPI